MRRSEAQGRGRGDHGRTTPPCRSLHIIYILFGNAFLFFGTSVSVTTFFCNTYFCFFSSCDIFFSTFNFDHFKHHSAVSTGWGWGSVAVVFGALLSKLAQCTHSASHCCNSLFRSYHCDLFYLHAQTEVTPHRFYWTFSLWTKQKSEWSESIL